MILIPPKYTLKPVSHECVLDYIQSLSENKATGIDNISARLLKKAGVAIVDPITHIINLSLQTHVFPDSWKRARLNPIYKAGDHTDPGNYRPIAILQRFVKKLSSLKFMSSLMISFIAINQVSDHFTAPLLHYLMLLMIGSMQLIKVM